MTEMKDLFMASHMCMERMAPELPTKAPVTMSKSLPNMNPAAEAAQPEYEFSIETTTGISPPPIAMTKIIPMTAAIAVIAPNAIMPSSPSALQNTIPATTQIKNKERFMV